MTRDEIIELAKQSGINATADTIVSYGGFVDSFERFANLVAEKEREECAKLCDYLSNRDYGVYADKEREELHNEASKHCAEAIRARRRE